MTRHVPGACFRHPQIAFDGGPVDQASHEKYCAILGRGRVNSGAVARERTCGGSEVQTTLRPRVRRFGEAARWWSLRGTPVLAQMSASARLCRWPPPPRLGSGGGSRRRCQRLKFKLPEAGSRIAPAFWWVPGSRCCRGLAGSSGSYLQRQSAWASGPAVSSWPVQPPAAARGPQELLARHWRWVWTTLAGHRTR